MPPRLYRCYGAGYLHFITTSCYERRPLLDSACNRDLFLQVLEQVRRCYRFVVVGYAVMPEHVHLLLSEPQRSNLSVVMQAMKQSFTSKLIRRLRTASAPDSFWTTPLNQHHIWQRRFYDFPVFTRDKRIEKLLYLHRNAVTRRLVAEPDQWQWSSFRHYAYDEPGPVLVNEQQKAEMIVRAV